MPSAIRDLPLGMLFLAPLASHTAYDLLAPVYAWFTEGFATQDLKEAKALLDELGDVPALQPHGDSTAADAGADDT